MNNIKPWNERLDTNVLPAPIDHLVAMLEEISELRDAIKEYEIRSIIPVALVEAFNNLSGDQVRALVKDKLTIEVEAHK
jgi:hypothetical protein